MAEPGAPAAPANPSSWKLPQLRITRDGEWLDDGEEITHPGILENLWSNLRVDDQGHYLQVGPARIPVAVDDAPFVAVRAEVTGGQMLLTLNDHSREPLGADTLSVDSSGVPHCRVKGGTFAARFSRAATYQLLEHLEYDESTGTATLALGASPRRVIAFSPPSRE